MKKESEIVEIFSRAYYKCKSCYECVTSENMKQDFWNRMDEIVLIYSYIFDLNPNNAKNILKNNCSLFKEQRIIDSPQEHLKQYGMSEKEDVLQSSQTADNNQDVKGVLTE